jgi:hypothetical protein
LVLTARTKSHIFALALLFFSWTHRIVCGSTVSTLEHVVATFAAMALRVPSNCDRILACGGGKAITHALRRFPDGPVSLQRQCCLAVNDSTFVYLSVCLPAFSACLSTSGGPVYLDLLSWEVYFFSS